MFFVRINEKNKEKKDETEGIHYFTIEKMILLIVYVAFSLRRFMITSIFTPDC